MGEAASEWASVLAARHQPDHTSRCLGSAAHIDAAARRRGRDAITVGGCVSLATDLRPAASLRPDEGRPSVVVSSHVLQLGDVAIGSDRAELDAHGVHHTHLDGLTHVGLEGTWHTGASSDVAQEDDDSLVRWGHHGLSTRGVLFDLTAHHDVPWLDTDHPVGGDDLDACLQSTGTTFESGDAALLYMGRDRFEAAGNTYLGFSAAGDRRAGVGRSGAEWLADHRVGLVCWDFLDALEPGRREMSVHLLVWAIGLVLVDNCDLGVAQRALAGKDAPTGLLSVAPLPLRGATGCLVNPLLLF